MGSSRLQGPHQEAQKVRITTLSCWLLKVTSSPVTRLRTLKSGAMVPTAGPDGTSVAPKAQVQKRIPSRQRYCFMRTPCVRVNRIYTTNPLVETTVNTFLVERTQSGNVGWAVHRVCSWVASTLLAAASAVSTVDG